MEFNRVDHTKFLKEEKKALLENYALLMNTKAIFLLEHKDELFTAQFLGFKDGELILKFPNKRQLPRVGSYLFCFTMPRELRFPKSWGDKTYLDLLNLKYKGSEIVCIWQAPSKDKDGEIEKDFSIAGFRGVDMEFAIHLQKAEGMILLLGPNKPPFEYIENLQKIVEKNNSEAVNKILDQDFQISDWTPSLLDNKSNIADFVLSQLTLQDTMIIQGPPGTGKTHLIAEICEKLCKQGKSVLVTALTNRALIEIIDKPALKRLLEEHRIFKTKLSVDEAKAIKHLQQTNEVIPQPFNLILSTFFIASGQASKINSDPPFDYVIVDEASQALLGMFAAAKVLGKKNIWIGDTKQLPPIVELNEDKISRKNYDLLVDGFKAITSTATIPIYQLTETFRLSSRSAFYTGLFYNNTLKTKATSVTRLYFPELSDEINIFLNPQGGPTLIKTELEVGNKKPKHALNIVKFIVGHLMNVNEELNISILSNYVETVKALQKDIFQQFSKNKNILIETVARIQGLTTDIVVFVIPNVGYNHSLAKELFNVATSRAKRHTIIICDVNILTSYPHIEVDVKVFLQKLNDEFSFFFNPTKKLIAKHSEEKKEIQKTETSQTQIGLKIIDKIDISKFQKPKKEISLDKENIYIIDTNVFVDYPDIISKIDKQYQIVLSAKVIDELDYLKISLSEDQRKNVHKAIKEINENFERRKLKMVTADVSLIPEDFNKKTPDNFILSVALKYKNENPILLTSDNGLQIKAKGLNVTTISLKEFLRQKKY